MSECSKKKLSNTWGLIHLVKRHWVWARKRVAYKKKRVLDWFLYDNGLRHERVKHIHKLEKIIKLH